MATPDKDDRVSVEKQKAILADRKEHSRQIFAAILLPAYMELRKAANSNDLAGSQVEIVRAKWIQECNMAAAQAMEAAAVFQTTWIRKKAMFIKDPT